MQDERAAVAAYGRDMPPEPLVMLAHGDSWFDYPLNGNDVCIGTTDIIVQLRTMGDPPPIILNMAHHGDATTTAMSLPKQMRLIAALSAQENWGSKGQPDAILFSGGGNDFSGDIFCIMLDQVGEGDGLNMRRFHDAISISEAAYLDLFAVRDRWAPGTPIFGHTYDFPIPDGRGVVCSGPWLYPSLAFRGWTDVKDGTRILHQCLTHFADMQRSLARDPRNGFFLIETQGTLSREDWANELHPYPAGFRKIAAHFVKALRRHPGFAGRI